MHPLLFHLASQVVNLLASLVVNLLASLVVNLLVNQPLFLQVQLDNLLVNLLDNLPVNLLVYPLDNQLVCLLVNPLDNQPLFLQVLLHMLRSLGVKLHGTSAVTARLVCARTSALVMEHVNSMIIADATRVLMARTNTLDLIAL